MDQVYLDEALPLIQKISTRRLDEYKMMVRIYHTDKPQELLKILEQMGKKQITREFDSAGFEALTFAMSQNPHIKVKR